MTKDIIYCSIILVLLTFFVRGCDDNGSLQSRLTATADSLHIKKNKDGSEEASKLAMVEDVADLKKSTPKTDTEKRLKKDAKEFGGKLNQASAVNEVTQEAIGGKPVIDTTKIPPIASIKPQNRLDGIVYRRQFNTDWRQMDVYASKDTIWVNYRIVNKMDVTFGYERLKFKDFLKDPVELFQPRAINTTVKNLNPNTGVVQESSFSKRERKHYTAIKVVGGIVLFVILKAVLTK